MKIFELEVYRNIFGRNAEIALINCRLIIQIFKHFVVAVCLKSVFLNGDGEGNGRSVHTHKLNAVFALVGFVEYLFIILIEILNY